jgi:hypothetical protein
MTRSLQKFWLFFSLLFVAACDGDFVNGELAVHYTPYSYNGSISISLSTNQTRVFPLAITSGEVLAAHIVPDNVIGDTDLTLYDKDPTAPFNFPAKLKTSRRGSGYVDGFFWPRPMGGSTTVYLEVKCFQGPCSVKAYYGVGDSNNFRLGGVYVNQRSWQNQYGKCGPYANGECMCAPSSAANRLVLDGKRRIDQIRASAEDLFTTNAASGAADRTALTGKLKQSYGYSLCGEEPYTSPQFLNVLKSELRAGSMVLFRSNKLMPDGHWVDVRGIDSSSGTTKLYVDDPYGEFLSTGNYNKNSTSQSSALGMGKLYSLSSIANNNASIIYCR